MSLTGSDAVDELCGESAPRVQILDARLEGLDASALRERARLVGGASGFRYVSRSYRYPYALIGCHSEPVGIDIERVSACDAAFADLICTPEERFDPALVIDPDGYLTSLWCAKEALSKALGDALRHTPSRLGSPARWPLRRSGPWQAARLEIASGHVAWVCWRSPQPSAGPQHGGSQPERGLGSR